MAHWWNNMEGFQAGVEQEECRAGVKWEPGKAGQEGTTIVSPGKLRAKPPGSSLPYSTHPKLCARAH